MNNIQKYLFPLLSQYLTLLNLRLLFGCLLYDTALFLFDYNFLDLSFWHNNVYNYSILCMINLEDGKLCFQHKRIISTNLRCLLYFTEVFFTCLWLFMHILFHWINLTFFHQFYINTINIACYYHIQFPFNKYWKLTWHSGVQHSPEPHFTELFSLHVL